MKKMIQKLIKKIKEHKFFRKFSCLTVACLLLFYMTSVSVFAAEGDEAAAQPQQTESITDVWSAVMDGIMDLINAAQGVFFRSDDLILFSPEFGDSIDLFGASFTEVLNFPSDPPGSLSFYIIDLGTVVADLTVTDFGLAYYFQGYPVLSYFSSGDYIGWYVSTEIAELDPSYYSFSFIYSSGSSLTFIGTLAVLGVSIAVIMLLVYVVVSFIRLRG